MWGGAGSAATLFWELLHSQRTGSLRSGCRSDVLKPLTSEQELLEFYQTEESLEKGLMVWGYCASFYSDYFQSI